MNDVSLQIDDDEMIRVPHFAELPQNVRERWGQILGDYRMIQPVAQLSRSPHDLLSTPPTALDKIIELTSTPASPVYHTVISRILKQHGGCKYQQYSTIMSRKLTRCDGVAQYAIKGDAFISSVTLSFLKKAEEDPVPYLAPEQILFSEIHPVELAEALHMMRLISEAAN
jgi:hypothetical protein